MIENLSLPSEKKARKARARAKKVRRESARRDRNRTARGEARTLVTKARGAIEGGDDVAAATVAVDQALSTLDVAAGKGIIHTGNAGRRKSRLMASLNSRIGAEAASKARPKASPKASRPRKKSA